MAVAKAGPPAEEDGVIERGRDEGQPEAIPKPLGSPFGGEPALGAQLLEGARCQVEDPLLHGDQPESDPGVRPAAVLGRERARELTALAHDDVGAERLDRGQHARQGGARGDATEHVARHPVVGLREARGVPGGEESGHLALWRVVEGQHRQARPREQRRPGPLGGDADLVAGAHAGTGEGHERQRVAGVAGGREEDPHAQRSSKAAS